MKKPIIIIGVKGGIADYQTIPPNAVEVVHIDWDNLKDGLTPDEQVDEAQALMVRIKELMRTAPNQPWGYLKGLLEDLQDARDKAQKEVEDGIDG